MSGAQIMKWVATALLLSVYVVGTAIREVSETKQGKREGNVICALSAAAVITVWVLDILA